MPASSPAGKITATIFVIKINTMNVWSYTGSYTHGNLRQGGSASETQERDRRSKAIRTVSVQKIMLENKYANAVSKEYLSLLFRQRGVPSVDVFTYEIMSSFRTSMGFPGTVTDVIRRVLSIGRWSNGDATVTMWTIEPVIATVCIKGNTLNVADAKAKFLESIDVIDPLTTTTHQPTVVGNEIKGRWAGWLTWMELVDTAAGNPACMSCNMCGPSFLFAIHKTGSSVIQMMMTPKSIDMISNYSRGMNAKTGATASLITTTSTRLKVQTSLDGRRSTSLTLYGNGSMQFSGSPHEIPILYPSVVEIVKATMNSEMVGFLKTMRRMDSKIV